MTAAEVVVNLRLKLEPDEPMRAMLVAAGWTPPGEVGVNEREHLRVSVAKLRDERDAAIEELRRVKLATRAEVAEEIARDLERDREWRVSSDRPSPWAAVARSHAGVAAAFAASDGSGTTCTMCGHLVEGHGTSSGGCRFSAHGHTSKRCSCAQTHGRR